MVGANALPEGELEGEILLNLDTEDEGEMIIGSAGGVDVTAEIEYKDVAVEPGDKAVRILIDGLHGGHSGLEIGLGPDDEQSYRYFMNTHLFDHVNIDKARTFVPDGLCADADAACRAYNAIIAREGGIDMQLLGMGANGHIGFNEPGAAFESETHCVDLTESTIEANKRFFASAGDVPRQAYTMGIKGIMQARKIVVIVSGENKAQALRDALYGKVTPAVPASILQLHNDVTIVADEAARSLLNE